MAIDSHANASNYECIDWILTWTIIKGQVKGLNVSIIDVFGVRASLLMPNISMPNELNVWYCSEPECYIEYEVSRMTATNNRLAPIIQAKNLPYN